MAATLSYSPVPLPASAAPEYFESFGRVVQGFDPASYTPEQMKEIVDKLYEHGVLVFKNMTVTPKQQFEITSAFDTETVSYGHGNNATGSEKKSILHPDLKTIPHQPQVQLIGNGLVKEHEGLVNAQLKHPHHKTFHKEPVTQEDEANGNTRFYRWHIDAALYALNPPIATSLHAIAVPKGAPQTCRYDDGTGDELTVPLGTTAFVSGQTMFEVLPEEMKSLAVRTKVRYAPHPYVWMSAAHALPTGLGIENEGLELALEDLPEWEESKIKTFPLTWKNPVTGKLHLQCHPCGAHQLLIEPCQGAALYPDGAHLTDLKQVRELLYKMQRPGIAPKLVYPVDWEEGDFVLFHNRGLLHSVVGAFAPDQIRMFHQCNLAGTQEPVGPSEEDVKKYTL